jgi:LEA14-like dessication related protein
LLKNDEKVRNAWGELIRDAKRLDVYVAMRARIALRKAKLPIPVEKVNQEMVKIRNHNGRPVSIEDIVAAFDRGAEVRGFAIS